MIRLLNRRTAGGAPRPGWPRHAARRCKAHLHRTTGAQAHRFRAWVSFLATFAWALTGAGVHSQAHVPPPIVVELEIQEERVSAFYSLETDLYAHWLERDPHALATASEAERATALAGFAAFLEEVAPLSIDRTRVRPVVDSVFVVEDDDGNGVRTYATVNAHFPAKGAPSQLAFAWNRYDSYDGFPLAFVRFTLVHDGDFSNIDLTPEERGYTWHAPVVVPLPPTTPFVPGPPPGVDIPVLSLGVLVLAGLTLLVASRRLAAVARWGLALGATVLALALSPVASVEVHLPWMGAVRRPNEAESRYLFESLLRNIYRAFDYSRESEIYDALAESVDVGLIDSIYQEVYQSLILRDEGGAVSRVRSVKVLESVIEPPVPSHAPGFRVDGRWQVVGTVEHWGHSHWRTNQYQARFSLAPNGSGWRITAVELIAQERVGEARPSQQPTAPQTPSPSTPTSTPTPTEPRSD